MRAARISPPNRASVTTLLSQMVAYVATSIVMEQQSEELGHKLAHGQMPSPQARVVASHRRSSTSPENIGVVLALPAERRRALRAASSGGLVSAKTTNPPVSVASARRMSHSAGARAGHGGSAGHSSGTRLLGGATPAGGGRPEAAPGRVGMRPSSSQLAHRGKRQHAGARGSGAAARERSDACVAGAVLDSCGPNGGDPVQPHFAACAGDAALAGDTALVRMLQRRVAQLSTLRYETMRQEKSERLERARTASAAAVLAGCGPCVGQSGQNQSVVFSGEVLAALMKLERVRGANQNQTPAPVAAYPCAAGCGEAKASDGASAVQLAACTPIASLPVQPFPGPALMPVSAQTSGGASRPAPARCCSQV